MCELVRLSLTKQLDAPETGCERVSDQLVEHLMTRCRLPKMLVVPTFQRIDDTSVLDAQVERHRAIGHA